MALPLIHRLRANQEISRILRSTRPHQTAHLSVRWTDKNEGPWQAAVLIPATRVRTAVQRHRHKRIIVEVIQNLPIKPGVRIIISVTRTSDLIKEKIEQEILSVLEKSDMLKQ